MNVQGMNCDACGEDCGYVPPYTETSIVVRVAERRVGAPLQQFSSVDPLSRLIMRGFIREVPIGNGQVERRHYNRLDLCGKCDAKRLTEEGRAELVTVLTPKAVPEVPQQALDHGITSPEAVTT